MNSSADLMVRLLLNTQGFDKNLQASTLQIKDLQAQMGDLKNTLSSFSGGLGINISSLAKFATTAGAAAAAGKVLADAFMKNESNADSFSSAMEQSKAAYSSFLNTINGGSWSNFFSNISSAIKDAKELYDLLDRAGSTKANNSYAIAFIQNQIQEVKRQLNNPNLTKTERNSLQSQLGKLNLRKDYLQKQGTSAELNAANKGMANIIKNRAASLGVILSDSEVKKVVEGIKKGQDYFDSQAKIYSDLRKKGTKEVTAPIATSTWGGVQYAKKNQFSLKSLSPSEQKQYAIGNAVTEGESELQAYLETAAEATRENTAALKESTKNDKASQTHNPVKHAVDHVKDKLEDVGKRFDELADEGIYVKDFEENKLKKLTLDPLKDLNNTQKAKLLPSIEKYRNDFLYFQDLHKSGIIDDKAYYKRQAEAQHTLGTNMSTVARDGVFRQESDAMTSTLFPFLTEVLNSGVEANKAFKNVEASTDFYNYVQKKILNDEVGKVMEYYGKLNKPLTEADYDKTLNQLENLLDEFIGIKDNVKNYVKDDPTFQESGRFVTYQSDQQIGRIEKAINDVAKEKLQYLNDGELLNPLSKGKRWRALHRNLKDTGLEILTVSSSIEKMSENWDNMSGFEKLKSLATFLTDTVYAIGNLTDAWKEYTRIVQLVNGLTAVTSAEQGILNTTQTAGAAEEVSANAAKIASNQALTASYSEAAAAGYMAAHSAIPFVGYGIGAGFTASSIATIKSAGAVGMFADGGIITGAGSGWSDSIPTLLSNGEMVLNRRQQGNLFALLDGSRVSDSAPSGGVEFKIKGTELVGVLKNYNKKTSKTL